MRLTGLRVSRATHDSLIDTARCRYAAQHSHPPWWERPFPVGSVFVCSTLGGNQVAEDDQPFKIDRPYYVLDAKVVLDSSNNEQFEYKLGWDQDSEVDLNTPLPFHPNAEVTFKVTPSSWAVEPPETEDVVARPYSLPSVSLSPYVHLVHEIQLVEYAVPGGFDQIALWIDGILGRQSFFTASEECRDAFTVILNTSGSTLRDVEASTGQLYDPQYPKSRELVPFAHRVAPAGSYFGRMVVDSAQACVDPCQFAGTQLGVTLRELKVIAKQRYWNYTSGQFEWRAVWPIHLRFRLLVSPHRRDGRMRSVGN